MGRKLGRTAEEKREAKNIANREWHRRNPEAAKKWRVNNPEKRKASSRRSNLLRHYSLTIDQFDAILESQGRVCAICAGEAGPKGFAVDHDHSTGTVRGILCMPCNTALGMMKDNPARLIAAANYLKGHT